MEPEDVEPGDVPDPVTVVVATRDRRERLARCLRALAALHERPPVIVVDNGSGDGTGALVRAEFPDVTLVELGVNHGAVARTVGVGLARTGLVAFADDDSGWRPGALRRAAGHFARYPRLALLAADIRIGDSGRPDPVARGMAAAPLGHEPDLPGPSVLGFLCCGAVVRRGPFLDTGGFDRAVFFYGEEERVAYDLARAGWGLAYCADVVAWHDPEPLDADRARERDRLAQRNAALTHWMRRPVRVALADTVRLAGAAVHDPHARTAFRELCARLPLALRLRGTPVPALEAAYARLARPRRSWTGTPSPASASSTASST